MRICIWFLVFQINESFGTKHALNVCALVEMTDYRYSQYYKFFKDIIEYAFEEMDNRADILQGYSLKSIPVDTKVVHFRNKLSFFKFN